MSDLFHNGVSFTLLNEIFETMRATPRHRYMILTKRPERMLKFVRHYNETVGRSHRMPFPNVWLGVSVENQSTANERLPKLLKTPAEIHFVSIEPMLGSVAIDFYFLALNNKEGRSLDWIICGCESGPGARPFNEQWARSLRDQCIRQHIPFFFKQNRTQDGRFIEMPRLDGKIWNQIPRRSNRVT
jgi:protein gp37